MDIAEGAPDYITGVPRVKAESSDSPQAPGREPDSSRGKHGSKGASSSRPAAEQGGTGRQGGGKKRPAPSSVRSMGNQPRAFGGRFAPKQQASRQVADTAELAMADVQQRGGRGGRHPRSAAVAAAGFAAAAVAANKGGLRRKASPGCHTQSNCFLMLITLCTSLVAAHSITKLPHGSAYVHRSARQRSLASLPILQGLQMPPGLGSGHTRHWGVLHSCHLRQGRVQPRMQVRLAASCLSRYIPAVASLNNCMH